MVWSLYFYFIFSSFLSNKGLLNLRRKTCLLGGGVKCYCSLQLLCQTLLPCCGELTPPRYLQANAFQSQNSRLPSQKCWDKAIWPLTSLTSGSSIWTTVPVMIYENTQLPPFNLSWKKKKEISPGSFACEINKEKNKENRNKQMKKKEKTSNAFSNLPICKYSSRVSVLLLYCFTKGCLNLSIEQSLFDELL